MTVEWHGPAMLARARLAAWRGTVIGTNHVLEVATGKIKNPPKTGKTYPRRGVRHQASAPGESPADDTGRLAGSGDVRYDQPTLTGFVNWAAAYARPLELGTEKMEPRPYARPALYESAEFIRAAVAGEIAQEFS